MSGSGVVVAGIGIHPFGRHEDRSGLDLGVAAARAALADAVVPICYAMKGTAFAADLWRYKSAPGASPAARRSLLALLLVFLHDHGACVWRHAGMPGPGRLAVVPTGSGRPGPHPLLALSAPYLRLPLTRLAIRPGCQGRDLDLRRFVSDGTAAGTQVTAAPRAPSQNSWPSDAPRARRVASSAERRPTIIRAASTSATMLANARLA